MDNCRLHLRFTPASLSQRPEEPSHKPLEFPLRVFKDKSQAGYHAMIFLTSLNGKPG
jgi:hypothetical protein